MSKEKTIFNLENDFDKLGNKYDKNKLNISFNRVAFIFFYVCNSFVYFFFKSILSNRKKTS